MTLLITTIYDKVEEINPVIDISFDEDTNTISIFNGFNYDEFDIDDIKYISIKK